MLTQLKSPFYTPVQYWYDAERDAVWKLRLGSIPWRLEAPTADEERSVREFNA
jgi:hypothetical protein